MPFNNEEIDDEEEYDEEIEDEDEDEDEDDEYTQAMCALWKAWGSWREHTATQKRSKN